MKYISILALFVSIGGLKAQFTTLTYEKKEEEPKTENFLQSEESKSETKEKKVKKKKKNKKELQKEVDSLNTVISVYQTMIGTLPNPKEENEQGK